MASNTNTMINTTCWRVSDNIVITSVCDESVKIFNSNSADILFDIDKVYFTKYILLLHMQKNWQVFTLLNRLFLV